jgi:hypothetical protein
MGKGGGGGGAPQQPTTTTAYQTNLPEYAQPYVMNMLGAAQNQLFTTKGNQITGFRGYQPYSSDPTDYFAGPTGLQQSAYNAAGMMQSPTQYQTGTGLASMAGLGQLGAGQQYASQVTDPSRVQSFMSPYQQGVTDVAKNAAIREYQIANQQGNLGAARQGTYGGARQALQQSERERNLLSNLSNIQAQGSQAAYDRAMQNMQFGSNLGLQGLAGAAGTAGTLGQLGGQQQQADINAINLQNTLGAAQQQYQQNIINQAIQDYATQQQYPLMQLSTMNSLLRGLPMQAMTTQGYQASPTNTQQLLGLAGTGASLAGAFKREGGTVKSYKIGGGIKASLENKIDDIADTGGVKGLQGLLAQTKSPQAKEMIVERMREEGIASAPTGALGRNLAGGGIIAFDVGGGVFDQTGTEEQEKYAERIANEKMARERKQKEAFLAENAPEALAALRKREAEPKGGGFTESSFKDFDQAQALFEKERYGAKPPAPAVDPAAATNTNTNTGKATGLDAILEDRRRRLGFDGPGEKSEAFMKALEERQAGLGKQNESDRYLRMAEAFSKFGSTAGPMASVASQALGGFAKGEAAARRDQDKMQMEGMKMQADLEKARRAEARGDLDAAEKFYNSAEDRKNRLDAANIGAAASGQATRFEQEAVNRIMKEEGISFAQALERVRGAGRSEGIDMQIGKEAYKAAAASVAPGGANAKKYKKLLEADPTGVEAEKFFNELAQKQIRGMKDVMGMSGGSKGAPGNIDTSNPLLK